MSNSELSSQITFLYFDDFPAACSFFAEVLELELAMDGGWAQVFRTGATSFVGAVDMKQGSIEVQAKGGVLISLTVKEVQHWYDRLKQHKGIDMGEVKELKDIGLKSFFIKGPEGYDFEIQEFTKPELRELF